MSDIYNRSNKNTSIVFSQTYLRKRINAFYRRCLRIRYNLFEYLSNNLHVNFEFSTWRENFLISLFERIRYY